VAEAFVNKQLRLLLEQQTAEAFVGLVRGPLRGTEFTLIGFDFGPEGNVAYKTTLDVRQLAPMVRGLLDRWASGTTRVGSTGDRAEVVDPDVLLQVNDKLQRELPAGVGFSLLIGSLFCTGYLSNVERVGVIECLGKLATVWEEEARA
jgi:hypothetical protein